MRVRDRRGPLTAVVLLAAYVVVATWAITATAQQLGLFEAHPFTPLMEAIVAAALAGFIWRGLVRCVFTAILYGPIEGLRAVIRMPIANIITIIAARRALTAYVRTLGGGKPIWEKTHHDRYPATTGHMSELPAQ